MTRLFLVLLLLGALLLAPSSAVAADDAFRFDGSNLPRGWRVKQTIVVPTAQLAGFAGRLGAEVVALENQVLDVGGLEARWNVIVAADEDGAKRVEATMLRLRGAAFVQRHGVNVYEVAGRNLLLARAVFAAAGYEEEEAAAYDVSFRTALVDEPDYTRVNRVFNHFLELGAGTLDEAAAKIRVTRDTAGWTFGKTLRLRASSPPEFEVQWTFDPVPIAKAREGDTVLYTFDEVPTLLGIPYVDVKARIRVRSRFAPTGRPVAKAPVAATGRWPASPVSALAAAAVEGVEGDRDRALALLEALHARVGHGGAMGSRDRVGEVLARGHGRCWDKSDVYVAMCRSVGLPARQVVGWVPALGAGHVWTEVHLAGEGWIPVDATTPWLGTGTDHVPFFLSEDGTMPFLYLRMPQLRRLEAH